ncbi:hypothetical protein FOC4_g10003856 [Fusarium odoratissimum]|uniref:Uncharacterized protein n=1 Tax=Fusarium oxysporum f. sp. cubense (strain race 4) TaxID=2502994 RepID=N1SA88_FUSC4|nr:hypothetical protein FOC4_g10003856 [Fusarium odoratissimum]
MASSITNSLHNMPLTQTKSSGRSSAAQTREKEYSGAEGHESHWNEPFSQCEKLRFLVDNLSGDDLHLSSEQEALRPLFQTYKRLLREVQKNHESRLVSEDSVLTRGGASGMLPARRTCDSLVDAYIKTFESVLRIIHVPSFLRDYEHFWENSASSISSTDETFACKLLLVAALGSITLTPTESQQDQATSWRDQSTNGISYVKDWLARKSMKGMRGDLRFGPHGRSMAFRRTRSNSHGRSDGFASGTKSPVAEYVREGSRDTETALGYNVGVVVAGFCRSATSGSHCA